MSYPVLFDGHELGSLFLVEWHVERELTAWQPDIVDAPGAIGSLWGGTQAQPVSVSMELTIIDKSRDGRQEALRTLAGWLAVDSPRVLQLGDEGGRYRMAAPTGNAGVSALLDADTVQIGFICPDPRLYGRLREIFVPVNGGPVTFAVGGTAPTMPTLSTLISATGADQYWRAALEDGSYVIMQPLTYGTSLDYDTIVVDCASRVMKSRNVVRMLPPSADWLVLTPGEHTLTVTSDSGGETETLVSWREMWW